MSAHDDFAAVVLGLAPAAYWDFAGAGAAGLNDRSGNGHTLTGVGGPTHNNVVPNLDGFHYALLNGTSQSYTILNGATLDFATFTFFAIVAPTAPDGYIYDNENATNTVQGWGAIVASAGNGSGLGVRLDLAATSIATLDPKPFGTYGNQFVMFGAIYDGTMQTIYLNGQPYVASLNQSFVAGTNTPVIGKHRNNNIWFKGGISDMAIFGGVLNTQTMLEIAQAAGFTTPASGAQVLDGIAALQVDLTAVLAAVRKTFG